MEPDILEFATWTYFGALYCLAASIKDNLKKEKQHWEELVPVKSS